MKQTNENTALIQKKPPNRFISLAKKALYYIITYMVEMGVSSPLIFLINKNFRAMYYPALNVEMLQESCEFFIMDPDKYTGDYQSSFNKFKKTSEGSFFFLFPLIAVLTLQASSRAKAVLISASLIVFYFLLIDGMVDPSNDPTLLINLLYKCFSKEAFLKLCDFLSLDEASDCVHQLMGDHEKEWVVGAPVLTLVYVTMIVTLSHFLHPKIYKHYNNLWDKCTFRLPKNNQIKDSDIELENKNAAVLN